MLPLLWRLRAHGRKGLIFMMLFGISKMISMPSPVLWPLQVLKPVLFAAGLVRWLTLFLLRLAMLALLVFRHLLKVLLILFVCKHSLKQFPIVWWLHHDLHCCYS